MKVFNKKHFLILSLGLILMLSGFVMVQGGDSQVSPLFPENISIPNDNYSIIINVVNTDSNENITKVNITLPAGFLFIENSNWTSASDTNFTNTSVNLTWENTTDDGFIKYQGGQHNFSFNISVPDSPGNYSFIVTTQFTDGSTNTSYLNFTLIKPIYVGNFPENCLGTNPPYWYTQPGNGTGFNLTNTTDFFFYDGGYVEIVMNLTGWNNQSLQNLMVWGNFSEIGGPEHVNAEYRDGLYVLNATVNFSNISSDFIVKDAVINLSAWSGSEWKNLSVIAVLMNMSVPPGCPPNTSEVPPKAPLENGTLVDISFCNASCVSDKLVECNQTDCWVCGPKWGGETTNFNQLAQSGDFFSFNLTLDIPGKAKIKFFNVSFDSPEKAQAIFRFAMENLMGRGMVGVNESEWNGSGDKPNLNLTAEITLYNVSGLGITDPFIGYGSFNGMLPPSYYQTCPPEQCWNITWDGENLSFTVRSFSTYVVNNTLHNLVFQNLSNMNAAVKPGENASFIINITNYGNATYEEYNLSTVNYTGNENGTLNESFIHLNYSESAVVELNFSSSNDGFYSVYILANHWNGSDTETNWNLSSLDDGVLLNITVDGTPPVINSVNLSYGGENKSWSNITTYQNITIIANITDNLLGVNSSKVWANITYPNGSSIILNLSSAGNNIYQAVWDFPNQNSENGTYNITIFANDTLDNQGSLFVTLDVLPSPDFVIPAIYWESENPYQGQTLNITFTVNNTGVSGFNGNVTVYMYWDGSLVNSTNVSNTSLQPGGSGFNLSLQIQNFNGTRNFTAYIDPNNGIEERYENNNNYTKFFSQYLNATVLSVTYNGVEYTNNSAKPKPGENITIKLSVKYYNNGSAVSGLGMQNFTLWDKWVTGGTGYRNYTTRLYEADFTQNGNGIYIFNYTVPSVTNGNAEYNTHNFMIEVKKTNYETNSSGVNGYSLNASNLVVSFGWPSITLYKLTSGSYETYPLQLEVINNGIAPIYNVTVKLARNSSGVSLSSYTCNIAVIPAGSTNTSCYNIKVTPSALGTYNISTSLITGTDAVGNVYNGTQVVGIVNVLQQSSSQDQQNQGGTTGSQNCTSDADCDANYACVDGVCQEISCPDGQIIDHLCVPYNYGLAITEYPEYVYVESGKTNSTQVTVKNTGDKTMVVKLDVIVSNASVSVYPEKYSLDSGESYSFTVNFSVSNTKLGNFTGVFKAYRQANSSFYTTKTFYLVVLPTEETKYSINISYQSYLAIVQELENQFKKIKSSGAYNESELELIEELLKQANETLKDIGNYIESDDYINAQNLLTQLNATINTIRTNIEDLSVTSNEIGINLWFWAGIGIVIVFVIGFFVYMFYPPLEGYHPQKGYRPPRQEKLLEKVKRSLKEFLNKLKRKKSAGFSLPKSVKISRHIEGTGRYMDGYKKIRGYEYAYSENVISKMLKKLGKKKRRQVADFFTRNIAPQVLKS